MYGAGLVRQATLSYVAPRDVKRCSASAGRSTLHATDAERVADWSEVHLCSLVLPSASCVPKEDEEEEEDVRTIKEEDEVEVDSMLRPTGCRASVAVVSSGKRRGGGRASGRQVGCGVLMSR